ncbi:regulation of nuclear pre-mRNA domain-containing protein 2a [Sardina pilchardus]|uniref:regulation of nuclear pre-mRNA domain-containing protein 2a n=1 Tax=Sardina pilchardus TaxID=27697 RepID=UPI002E15BD3B
MAAGGAAASSHGSRGSAAALESSLDRRFQVVTNTMESIQGLSTWCIDNKKYHNNIVRAWLKWIKKSDSAHRLNLFYLANDVIQNCKRKNAIVYRTSFTTVLPDSMEFFNAPDEPKVRKAVERTLTIWEERNIYSEEFIGNLRIGLQDKEPEEPAVVTPVPPTPAATPKVSAAQKSKIVAEFVPQSFVQKLQKHRSSVDEVDLREKQLAAMRVDVCSSEALKKLKDKAGGKKFAKDFEEGSAKLQEFVSILDGQVKKGPDLLEALQSADIFYEMQYKEVKIVTKAYETFANRVNHLKRKLDSLKASLPSLDDSPVPSPCADAPSPTGSESPFHGLAAPDPDLDGDAMDNDPEPLIPLGDAPSPLSSAGGSPKPDAPMGQTDNTEVEDMELSDMEETEGGGIIVEEQVEAPTVPVVSNPVQAPIATQPALTNEAPPVKHATPPSETPAAVAPPPAAAAAAAATAITVTPTTPTVPANLANVDLGKISSILNSIMKNTGVSPGSRPSSESPVAATSSPVPPLKNPAPPLKNLVPSQQSSSSLASILSKVDTSTILSALSKTQGQTGGLQGFSSILNNQSLKTTASPLASMELPRTSSFPAPSNNPIPTSLNNPSSQGPLLMGNSSNRKETIPSSFMPISASGNMQAKPLPEKRGTNEPSSSAALSSNLDSRIHNFFQGNQGLRDGLGFNSEPLGQRGNTVPTALLGQVAASNSPSLGQENLEGTPVRDESGGTPTQDEVSDASSGNVLSMFQGGVPKTGVNNPPSNPGSSQAPGAYDNEFWRNSNAQSKLYGAPNGSPFQQGGYNGMGQVTGPPGSELNPYQKQVPNTISGGKLQSDNQESRHDPKGGWYGQPYMDKYSDSNMAASSLNYGEEQRESEALRPGFFNTPLPPIPQLPPPPKELLSGPPSSGRLGPGPGPVAEPPEASSHPDVYHDPSHFDPVREDLLLPYPEPEPYPEEEMGHLGEPPFPRSQPYPHPHPHPHLPHPRPLGPGLDGGPRPPLHHPHGPPHPLPRRGLSPPPGPMGDYYDSHSPPPPHLRRGYYEDRSPSPPPFEDPYYDRYYDREARSPSPPPYPYRQPLSPRALSHPPEFDVYDYEHDLHPPEHRLPPHPFHPRPPHPMHHAAPIPQRPLGPRRPMPPRPPRHPHDPYRMPIKRPPFGGPPRGGGPFYPPKRPYLPPRF